MTENAAVLVGGGDGFSPGFPPSSGAEAGREADGLRWYSLGVDERPSRLMGVRQGVASNSHPAQVPPGRAGPE